MSRVNIRSFLLNILVCFFCKIGFSQNLVEKCICKTLYQFKDTFDCSENPVSNFIQHEYFENNTLIISTGQMKPLNVSFEGFIPRKLIKDTFLVENGIIRTNNRHYNRPIFSLELFLSKDTTYYYSSWLYGALNLLYLNRYEFVPIERAQINGVVSYKYWMTKTMFALKNGAELNRDSLILCLYNNRVLNIPIIEEPIKSFLYFIPDYGFLVDNCLEFENSRVYFNHWIEKGDCRKYQKALFFNWCK